MANVRTLKKEIDYILEELVFDCDMAMCFRPANERDIFEVMQEGVALRNGLYEKANNPAEPHNASLVRKHYSALGREIEQEFSKLFERLSDINNGKVAPRKEEKPTAPAAVAHAPKATAPKAEKAEMTAETASAAKATAAKPAAKKPAAPKAEKAEAATKAAPKKPAAKKAPAKE